MIVEIIKRIELDEDGTFKLPDGMIQGEGVNKGYLKLISSLYSNPALKQEVEHAVKGLLDFQQTAETMEDVKASRLAMNILSAFYARIRGLAQLNEEEERDMGKPEEEETY